jgi:hypothetical protein
MNHSPDTPQDRGGPDGPRQWKSKELKELDVWNSTEGSTSRDEIISLARQPAALK